MRNPFRSEDKEPPKRFLDAAVEAFLTGATSIQHNVKVSHEIRYAPKPRPNLLYFEISNKAGERWQVAPIHISGQHLIPVYFPLGFITGRDEDHREQVGIMGRLEYPTD
jgi:hypothetical protein